MPITACSGRSCRPTAVGEPTGPLAEAIGRDLGGYDEFSAKFKATAAGRFGSGWAWLSLNPEKKLVVEDTPNQNSPLMHGHTPLMGLDVWEHAYYLKYQNRRPEYINSFFHLIDWNAVSERYVSAVTTSSQSIASSSTGR